MPCFCCGSDISSCVRSGHERIVWLCTVSESGLKMPVWKMLWSKIKKEKRRFFFDCSSDHPVHVPYDPYSYSQNFDQGSAADPENMSRSFSARFAVPSRIFEESGLRIDGKQNRFF